MFWEAAGKPVILNVAAMAPLAILRILKPIRAMENDDYEEFASDGIFEATISCYTVTATSSTLLASLC